MAITDSILNFSNAFLNSVWLIKIVSAIIVLFIGLVIGRVIGKLVLKLLREIEFDKTVKKATGYKSSIAVLISKFSSYVIYFLTLVIVLETLSLTSFVLNMITLAIILIVVLSLVLGLKDFMPNFIAGYSIRQKALFKIGERIKIGSVEGKIIKINLLDTQIKTPRKDLIMIPNSHFIKKTVIKKF